jgi:hypothetical protein
LIPGRDKVGVTSVVGVGWLEPPLQAARSNVKMAIMSEFDFFIDFQQVFVGLSSLCCKNNADSTLVPKSGNPID